MQLNAITFFSAKIQQPETARSMLYKVWLRWIVYLELWPLELSSFKEQHKLKHELKHGSRGRILIGRWFHEISQDFVRV